MQIKNLYRALLWVQGTYILLTALWGLIDIESFMQVTGPKTDIWLVKTVSLLLLPVCVCFACALFHQMHPLPVILTGLTAAAGLAFVDFYYTAHRVIKWVYALDGAAQVLFIFVWILLWIKIEKLMSP